MTGFHKSLCDFLAFVQKKYSQHNPQSIKNPLRVVNVAELDIRKSGGREMEWVSENGLAVIAAEGPEGGGVLYNSNR